MTGGKFSKVIETAANLAILAIVLFIAASWVESRFLKPRRLSHDLIGQSLQVPEAHWDRAKATLVFVLRSDCRFCKESAPFYKQLTHGGAVHENVRFMAVLPDRTDLSREYLTSLGVDIPEVLQMPLHSLSVKGTPSLLLVSNQGHVLKQWTGKLKPLQEQQVIEQIASVH